MASTVGSGPGLDENDVIALQQSWRAFAMSDTFYNVAAALYSAFSTFDPTMAEMFRTPQVTMGPKIHRGLSELIEVAGNERLLQQKLEVLAFRHLDLAIDVNRIGLLSSAVLDMLAMHVGPDLFGAAEANAWSSFLTSTGKAMLTLKDEYTERVGLLISSWARANQGNAGTNQKAEVVEEHPDILAVEVKLDHGKDSESQPKKATLGMKVPDTVPDMFMFNAAVMGFKQKAWMSDMLKSFEVLVTYAGSPHRVQEEIDFLGLRMSKFSGVDPRSFGNVMFASLRALLPAEWGSKHELAWSWFWQTTSGLLMSTIALPAAQFSRLNSFLGSLSEQQLSPLRRGIFDEFFVLAPSGQEHFKQSAARLDSIIDRIVALLLDIYVRPDQSFEDLSLLGLRHVGFGSPTSLFGPFVSAAVKVFEAHTQDFDTQEAIGWSLSLLSNVLVRVITEGSNSVMQAINSNSVSKLRLSVSQAGRGDRVTNFLKLEVGSNSISPLMWAIENGSFEAAEFIIKDILTIRADRDRYYYGVDELFERHPDIVSLLCHKATSLLPTFLNLLI